MAVHGIIGPMELDEFLAAAVDLLAVRSTAERPEQLRQAVEFVVDFVGPGFRVEWFESDGKPSALIYAERPKDRPAAGAERSEAARSETGRPEAGRPEFRVIFNAHVDVVPGDDEQFRPRRDGRRLYARGAQDMKVAALAQAQAFRELAASVPFPIALQVVADEELGGQDGTEHQLQQGVTGEFVVIGERSGLDIVVDSKGVVNAELRATGLAGHGAYPWLGDNALVKLVNTVTRLLDKYPVPTEEAWRTTVNLARVETPNRTINQVPAEALAWLDIRYPAQDADFDGRKPAEIEDYLSTFCEPGVDVAVFRVDLPQHTDPDRAEVRELQRAAQREGYPSELVRRHGGSDAGFYAARGVAAVEFGVGGDGQHGPDEYVEIDTIVPYYRALKGFLERLTAAHNAGQY